MELLALIAIQGRQISRIPKKATGEPDRLERRWKRRSLGWSDAQKKPDGPNHMLHRFTPRRPGSPWSPKARATAEKLIAGGWMADPGLAEVARAQADGRWAAAYAAEKPAEIPDDFLTALATASEAAQSAFAALPHKARTALAFRLATAKSPSVRARRIADTIAGLDRGIGKTP